MCLFPLKTSESEYLTDERNWLEFADELDAIVERNMQNFPQYVNLPVVREPFLVSDPREEMRPRMVEAKVCSSLSFWLLVLLAEGICVIL